MNIFSAVKSQLHIVDVVKEYTSLEKAGSYYKGTCPLRSERTASFTVTPHKEIFYCFGCKEGGDVIHFISKMEQCTQLAAARLLSERYKITLPEACRSVLYEEKLSAYQRHTALCTLLAHWCAEQLKHAAAPQAYLTSRNIDQQSRERFGIGYLPSGDQQRKMLIRHLTQAGFLLDDLINIKFMMQGKHSVYSPFEERIIFPIADHVGNICGFGGRVFLSHDERAKYYNSHDHVHFSKGTLLFGLHLAKRAMHSSETALIVEGYTDCIALAQSGITHVVATLGTACTPDHLALLGRYVHTITVLYDGDRAGREACLRLSEHCWNSSLDLMFLTLPAGFDPASYLQAGHAINTLVAQDVFSWYLTSFASFATARLSEKLGHIHELIQLMSRVSDPLKQNLLIQQAAKTWNLPPKLLAQELQRLHAPQPSPAAQPQNTLKSASSKSQKEITAFARQTICAIINHKDRLPDDSRELVLRIVPDEFHPILHKLQDYKTVSETYQFSDFFVQLTSEEQSYILELIHTTSLGEKEIAIDNLMYRIKQRLWREDIRELRSEIHDAQQHHDPERLSAAVRQFERLKTMMHDEGII
jgi:DNA primase